MSHREELSSMFDYDRWATLQWLETARAMGEEAILLHMLQAQITWLSRIQGTANWAPKMEDFVINLERTTGGYKRLLLGSDLGQIVTYSNSRGEVYENTVSEILRQVLHHGTYHRGQLRGIAGERGIEFPETDFIAFVRSPFGRGSRISTAGVM